MAGAVATAVGMAAAGMGVADAAADPPPLAFTCATPNVIAERYVYDGEEAYLDFDLGVNVIAGKDPFEIRATRTSYAKPIVGRAGRRQERQEEDGGAAGRHGHRLGRAARTSPRSRIKNAAGTQVARLPDRLLPATRTTRRGPGADAPGSDPVPAVAAAGDNPFTLGAVWGIQAGWNAATDQPAARPATSTCRPASTRRPSRSTRSTGTTSRSRRRARR